MTMSGAVALS